MTLTSLFNLKGLLIAFGIGAAVAAVPTGIVVYKIMDGVVANLKLNHEKQYAAGVKAAAKVQKAQDDAAIKGAETTSYNQGVEDGLARTVTKEIIRYVSNDVPCITYGLVRVLNYAASGDPAALAIAPGKPDDACAPVSWRAFADDIADDYHTGRLNASQLNDLIGTVKDINEAGQTK